MDVAERARSLMGVGGSDHPLLVPHGAGFSRPADVSALACGEWALQGSNLRPLDYESAALTD